MVYYLDNKDVMNLTVDRGYVAFSIFCHIREAPILSTVRFKPVSFFSPHHMEMVVKLLQSPNNGDRNIGLSILQQTLKVTINGEILG